MNREEYIYKQLEKLSSLDKALSQEIAVSLGEWATIEEVAKYLKDIKIPSMTKWTGEIFSTEE